MKHHPGIPAARGRQRGVTTLIIVSLLFFILSLVAAYTNRNMLFEQRTSGNQYRSTQAFEAAEAGVEWALAMLNSGRIDADCQPSADAAQTSFRQRYLNMSADTGLVDPGPAFGADLGGTVWPSCVFDGAAWDCHCPVNGAPDLDAPAGAGVFPAFRIRFVRHNPQRPGLIWLEVNGCTRLDNTCLDFPAAAVAGEGRARSRVLLALKSALPAVPSAALVARGTVTVPVGATLAAYNGSPGTSGLAVMAGGSVDGSVPVGSAPGTPGDPALLISASDPALDLTLLPEDDRGPRFFSSVFAANVVPYRDQAAVFMLACDPCDADAIRAAASRNPGRILWAAGNVTLDAGGAVGAPNAPVLLVVEGELDLSVPVHGVIYGRGDPWVVAGAGGNVQGALVAENGLNLAAGAQITVSHEIQTLNRLRWMHGSFVRVPGGWRDF
jgi:hypothetical protein